MLRMIEQLALSKNWWGSLHHHWASFSRAKKVLSKEKSLEFEFNASLSESKVEWKISRNMQSFFRLKGVIRCRKPSRHLLNMESSGQEWLVQICQCQIEGEIFGFNEDTKSNLVLLEVSALLVAKDSFCFICWTWSLRSGEQVSSFSSVIEANFGKHFFTTQPMTLISWSLHFFTISLEVTFSRKLRPH